MIESCKYCLAGAKGGGGHSKLFVERTIHAMCDLFKCLICGTEWTRTHLGAGRFEWQAVAAPLSAA